MRVAADDREPHAGHRLHAEAPEHADVAVPAAHQHDVAQYRLLGGVHCRHGNGIRHDGLMRLFPRPPMRCIARTQVGRARRLRGHGIPLEHPVRLPVWSHPPPARRPCTNIAAPTARRCTATARMPNAELIEAVDYKFASPAVRGAASGNIRCRGRKADSRESRRVRPGLDRIAGCDRGRWPWPSRAWLRVSLPSRKKRARWAARPRQRLANRTQPGVLRSGLSSRRAGRQAPAAPAVGGAAGSRVARSGRPDGRRAGVAGRNAGDVDRMAGAWRRKRQAARASGDRAEES